MILPIPARDYIPDMYLENYNEDEGLKALCGYIDKFISDNLKDISGISDLQDVFKCPAKYLDYLGYWVNAGIKSIDSEHTKRSKIYYAITTHKRRSTWNYDAKLRIDAITGYDARIYSTIDSDDSIELANETTDPDYYWSTESANDGTDDELGTWELGTFSEVVITGIVCINCHYGVHTAVLTADEINEIKSELTEDVVPAYFEVQLGYLNASGQFIIYNNGVI